MEVQTLTASIPEHSFKNIAHHDYRMQILPVNTDVASSNYKLNHQPSIESMEDLFDGATQTHTQETMPSQVPKSLEQKLFDGNTEALDDSNADPIQEVTLQIMAALEIDNKKRLEQNSETHTQPDAAAIQTEPSSITNDDDHPLDNDQADSPCGVLKDIQSSPPQITPSATSSSGSLSNSYPSTPSGYQSDISNISLSSQEKPLTPNHDERMVPHIIIDKTSIPGINLAPSAFMNNSYLNDTDDETSSQKSKEPMYPSSPGSSLLSPQTRSDRRRSQPASDSPRMVEISGSKYILYGRSKSRSLHDAQETSRSGRLHSRRMSAIGEIVGGSMKYGIGKLLRKKRWQEEGKQSKEDGKWRYALAKLQ
ncbi:hypothetical protein K493DRAFT_314466 [Basidiobolus meristosporus CBS 931.73]|uniref:Uncharacterized protein n=1 Tax=Basidiobolus meristosporus CBS 931.73 TaxID=1314790 RepID=A0A1Y1YEU9_9FUNG|nr:hypothetical protein K493DRAFT_314466 [Basidiobolus meristosporus CBS 931.73]|eukprot:ORX96522.1 hypothetical protein K493DRAFT_314466 [Basidiobolus meristosporus CBS 931.73]